MADTEFALDRSINGCVVTRELIQEIEARLKALEQDLFGHRADAVSKYDLSVFDAYGSETFRSACDLPMRGFPETTETVRVVLEAKSTTSDSTPSDRYIKVKLAFRNQHGNQMSVRIRSPLSREKVIGFCERIDQLIEPHETDAWLFRRRDWVLNLCGLVAVLGGFVWVVNIYDQITAVHPKIAPDFYWALTVLVWTALAYLGIVHTLFPQCAFETSRWRKREKWRTWAVEGFATVLLFDTVVTALKKHLLPLIGIGGP